MALIIFKLQTIENKGIICRKVTIQIFMMHLRAINLIIFFNYNVTSKLNLNNFKIFNKDLIYLASLDFLNKIYLYKEIKKEKQKELYGINSIC